MVIHHFLHFAAAAAERFHHDSDECFRAIHDQQFERLDAAAVFIAHDDLRLADHQFVAFAAHRLNQNRELQFAAPENAKRVRGARVFHAQRDVGEQFLFEARAQIARSYVLPFAARERRGVDGEDHRQRRLVNHERFERQRIREVGDAFADLNAFDARNRGDVARGYFFRFVAFEAAEREKLRNFRRLNRAIQLRNSDFGAALQRSLKNAGDGHAPEKFAVIEIRHLNLQHRRGVAGRRRNRSDDLLEERLKIGRIVADFHVRDADLRIRIDHRKIELVFGGIEVDEKVVDFVEDGSGARVGPINFVEHHDRLQLRGERLLQDVARLRQRPFARVHQNEHAIHHAQRAFHFAAEIAVAGRVHDIDFRVVIGDRGILRENRDSALALEVVGIHNARDNFLVRAKNAALLAAWRPRE